MQWPINDDDRRFWVLWVTANVVGWAVGILLGGGLFFMGVALALMLPRALLLLIVPVAGASVGAVVGYPQWAALFDEDEPRVWWWGSIGGGAVGAVIAGGLALLLSFDPFVAQLSAGGAFCAGIAAGQMLLAGGNVRAVRRWALVNGFAGAVMFGVGGAGDGLWVLLTVPLGALLFGGLTGVVLLRLRS